MRLILKPSRQPIVAELCDRHLLPASWVHGDFAPWNIKCRRGQKLMLIDWEDAQRGGFPLHDYFHFLHMQDYLFGQRPAMHFAGVGSFAETIGRHNQSVPSASRSSISRTPI